MVVFGCAKISTASEPVNLEDELMGLVDPTFDVKIVLEQGVWGETDSGTRVRLDDEIGPHWKAYEGQRVHVWQASDTQKITKVRATTTDGTVDPLGFGEAQNISGQFSISHGEEGSKSAEDSWVLLTTSSGITFEVLNPEVTKSKIGRPFQVVFREAERSPFVTRRGGRYCWVLVVTE